MMASALKHSPWLMVLEKMDADIPSWTFRELNMVSHLILIKEVLQFMPLYLFSVLAAPKWILKAIKNLQRGFLWGNMKQKRKWALVKWNTVFLSKTSRGIELRDPQHNNTVMGACIWWKWISDPHTPWAIL